MKACPGKKEKDRVNNDSSKQQFFQQEQLHINEINRYFATQINLHGSGSKYVSLPAMTWASLCHIWSQAYTGARFP